MAYPLDPTLSDLCDRRENLRIQLSVADDAVRPDTRLLLNGRASLILLEAEIVALRRKLGRPLVVVPGDMPTWSIKPEPRSAVYA